MNELEKKYRNENLTKHNINNETYFAIITTLFKGIYWKIGKS